MALWWTENDITKVAQQVLESDIGRTIARQHIEAVLREEDTRAMGAELRARAEHLADQGKAALQRKFDAAYTAQAERLNIKLGDLEKKLESTAPNQEKRLTTFENRIEEVEEAMEGWLDEPTRSMTILCDDGITRFTAAVERIMESSVLRTQDDADQAKRRIDRMMQTKLHTMVLAAVREHVKSLPFEQDQLSNRQLAAARGVSLREAKRIRRAALR